MGGVTFFFRALGTGLSSSLLESAPRGSTVGVLCPKSSRVRWSELLKGFEGRLTTVLEASDAATWEGLLASFPAVPRERHVYFACSARAVFDAGEGALDEWWSEGSAVVEAGLFSALGSSRGMEKNGGSVEPCWDPSRGAVRARLLPSSADVGIAGPVLDRAVASDSDLWGLLEQKRFVTRLSKRPTIVDQESPLASVEPARCPEWWDGSPLESGGVVVRAEREWAPLSVSCVVGKSAVRGAEAWKRAFDGKTFVEGREFERTDGEAFFRELRDDYVVVVEDASLLGACVRALRGLLARRHLDAGAHVSGSLVVVKPGAFRWTRPLGPDLAEWWSTARGVLAHAVFDGAGAFVGGSGDATRPKCWSGEWRERRVADGASRVAVLSMCGVSSFEDRYGLGGEHQVVHWLREDALDREDVELCDQFDQEDVETAPRGFYDVVFSNSAWCPPPATTPGGTSVFWHFNTNSWACVSPEHVAAMPYDVLWTNSRASLERLRELRGARVRLVDLNASRKHHFPPESETGLFSGDVCYVGGYQVHYKGKDRIERFVAPAAEVGARFAIYGNRKWTSAVQLEALRDDRLFKKEHYDPRWDPHYRGVLHPDDFRHVAKSCKIMLNFNAADQVPLGMVNDRPIWALACGGFVVTDDTPEQRALFGNAVEYTTGGDDLKRKIDRWLSDDDGRREVASRGPELVERLGLFTDVTVAKFMAERALER